MQRQNFKTNKPLEKDKIVYTKQNDFFQLITIFQFSKWMALKDLWQVFILLKFNQIKRKKIFIVQQDKILAETL